MRLKHQNCRALYFHLLALGPATRSSSRMTWAVFMLELNSLTAQKVMAKLKEQGLL